MRKLMLYNMGMHKKIVFGIFCTMAFSLPIIGYAPINIYGGLQISYLLGVAAFFGILINKFVFKEQVPLCRGASEKMLLTWILVTLITSLVMSSYIKAPFVTPFAEEYPYIKTLKAFCKISFVTCVYFATIAIVKDKDILKKAVRFLIYGGIFASLYGIYQIAAMRFDLPFLNIFSNNISFGGYESVGEPTVYGRVGYMIRIGSTAVEPGIFANYLTAIIPLYIILIMNDVVILKNRLADIATCILLLLAFVLTYSRAAWIAFAVISFFIVIYIMKRFSLKVIFGKILPALLVMVIAIYIIIASTLKMDIFVDVVKYKFGFFKYILNEDLTFNKNLSGNAYPAYDGRATILATGLKVFMKYPVFGVGWGNYGFYHYDNIPSWGNDLNTNERFKSQKWPSCRSIYLSTLAETGVVGGALFFLLLGRIFRNGWLTAKSSKDPFLKVIATGLLFSFSTIMIQGITLAPFKGYSYFWFILALIAATYKIDRA